MAASRYQRLRLLFISFVSDVEPQGDVEYKPGSAVQPRAQNCIMEPWWRWVPLYSNKTPKIKIEYTQIEIDLYIFEVISKSHSYLSCVNLLDLFKIWLIQRNFTRYVYFELSRTHLYIRMSDRKKGVGFSFGPQNHGAVIYYHFCKTCTRKNFVTWGDSCAGIAKVSIGLRRTTKNVCVANGKPQSLSDHWIVGSIYIHVWHWL